jgi:glycosyltransferase involved in cell wall biosynthesis
MGMSVLIPSDEVHTAPELANDYVRLGWEVVVGAGNFFLDGFHPDVLHCLWPEEFCGWKPPTMQQLAGIRRRLAYWADRCKIIVAVNNLWPHGQEGDPQCRALYDAFLEAADVVLHHSQSSYEAVIRTYEGARRRKHCVTTMFNYDKYLPRSERRTEARARFGFASEDFVLLVFGALRKWCEVELLRAGFNAAAIPRKKLLMAGRYVEVTDTWQKKWNRWSWQAFLKRGHVTCAPGFIPDEEVADYFAAADAVVVPRIGELSSGIIGAAMSFGKLIIAPDCGAFADYLKGTGNLLYRAGNSTDLARACERAAVADRGLIARQNRTIADRWTWERIVSDGLNALALDAPAMPQAAQAEVFA